MTRIRTLGGISILIRNKNMEGVGTNSGDGVQCLIY